MKMQPLPGTIIVKGNGFRRATARVPKRATPSRVATHYADVRIIGEAVIGRRLVSGPLKARTKGFTLIEVLVALAIIAIALGAALVATGALATNTDAARSRLLAQWSADNALAAVHISRGWPNAGQTVFACPQGQYRFMCRQDVTALSDPLLRQVSVTVYPSPASRVVLAEVVTVIQNEPQHY